ncbi:hypothetical protein BKA64DRAFT_649521 [Cadophora sp. MPI-SDFR-AT-0126]|nr:hypothetical protein BKA64DRAFT_649521 [Leotiomycetes sp. MPI-SDFR-AT-0126]
MEGLKVRSTGPGLTTYQVKRLLRIIRSVAASEAGRSFIAPVAELWPEYSETYAQKISNEVNLSTMREALQEGYYANMDSFRADAHLIYDNSITFNGPESTVSQYALAVRDTILEKIEKIGLEPVPAHTMETRSSHLINSSNPTASRKRKAPNHAENSDILCGRRRGSWTVDLMQQFLEGRGISVDYNLGHSGLLHIIENLALEADYDESALIDEGPSSNTNKILLPTSSTMTTTLASSTVTPDSSQVDSSRLESYMQAHHGSTNAREGIGGDTVKRMDKPDTNGDTSAMASDSRKSPRDFEQWQTCNDENGEPDTHAPIAYPEPHIGENSIAPVDPTSSKGGKQNVAHTTLLSCQQLFDRSQSVSEKVHLHVSTASDKVRRIKNHTNGIASLLEKIQEDSSNSAELISQLRTRLAEKDGEMNLLRLENRSMSADQRGFEELKNENAALVSKVAIKEAEIARQSARIDELEDFQRQITSLTSRIQG